MTVPSQVLIVEDDPDSALVMQLCVKRAFPEAVFRTVDSVRGAKKLSQELRRKATFDLVLLDGMLLDGTSSEAWRHIKTIVHPNSKIILTSAIPENLNSPITKGVPVDGYLQKPITPEDLIALGELD